MYCISLWLFFFLYIYGYCYCDKGVFALDNQNTHTNNYYINDKNNENSNTNNWAVIVSASRYWFNYRHLSNALTIYWMIKNLGIPDDRIILMNAHHDASSDSRNSMPGIQFSTSYLHKEDIQSDLMSQVQFDYLGPQVNPKTFSALLRGRRHASMMYQSQILNTNNESNILIYFSGHGGNEFLKFHDKEEISAMEIQDIFMEMYLKQRYKSILMILETCQAATLSKYITAPHVITLSSSLLGENSYSYHVNALIGVSVIDRFTYILGQFFQDTIKKHQFMETMEEKDALLKKLKKQSLYQLLNRFDPSFLHSTPSYQISDYPGFTYIASNHRQHHYQDDDRDLDAVVNNRLRNTFLLPYFSGNRFMEYSTTKTFMNPPDRNSTSINDLKDSIDAMDSSDGTNHQRDIMVDRLKLVKELISTSIDDKSVLAQLFM